MSTATAARPPQIPGYQYVGDIATGGYSVVYRYRQRSPRRDVAVKVLTEFDDAPVAPERREAEADMMAKLGNHPNIVQVIVADVTADGRHYIVMPYYPGRSLAEVIGDGPLTVGKVLRVGVAMAGALDAAHRLGLLHRDIKPANILLDEYGTPRLTDFGIAGWVGPGQRTDAGGMSLPWSPPEVVAGGENVRASDVFSLGATLYHLLVGRPPYARTPDTREALEARIRSTDAPPTGREDVPEALERLLARMLSRTSSRRPDSASLVAAELRDIEAALGGPTPDGAPWHDAALAGNTVPQSFVRTMLRDRPLAESLSPVGSGAPPVGYDGVTEVARNRPANRGVGAPASDEAGSGGRTRVSQWVLIVAAAVAVAVIVAGIVWSASGTAKPKPTVTDGGGDQNALVADQPPGAVTVTGVRSGKKIVFSWSYDGAQADDSFLWRTDGATKTTAVTQPTVTLDDPPGTQLCIQVKVVRANGAGSPDWSPRGCAS